MEMDAKITKAGRKAIAAAILSYWALIHKSLKPGVSQGRGMSCIKSKNGHSLSMAMTVPMGERVAHNGLKQHFLTICAFTHAYYEQVTTRLKDRYRATCGICLLVM